MIKKDSLCCTHRIKWIWYTKEPAIGRFYVSISYAEGLSAAGSIFFCTWKEAEGESASFRGV